MLVDCHTHLDSYPDSEIDEVVARAREVDVQVIVLAGTTEEGSRRCVDLTRRHHCLYAGVGIHPMQVTHPIDEATCSRLRALATSSPRVVTISEVGLDFMEGAPERHIQDQALRQQIRLARELRLPVIFHSREAHAETLRVLREEGAEEVGGAMHYFQADEATAWQAIEMGFYISLARPLLRLPHLQELASRLPLKHIVLETDSFPQPWKKYRVNWTEPRHTREIAEKLAELQGITLEEVANVTTANALAMLRGRASS